MWQRTVEPLVEAGELVAVGVVQEQHPDRARLYQQWRQLDWPIFVDSLNVLDLTVVPIPIAIDEHGIVRDVRLEPNEARAFVADSFATPEGVPPAARAQRPDPEKLLSVAQETEEAVDWRQAGDAFFLLGEAKDLDRSIRAYQHAVERSPGDGRSQFRLGVALWRRSESERGRKGDAQSAVAHWTKALEIDPNQYIWRRRLQQYGPRLDKPYNFYFWVEKAREDIRKRGEVPVALPVEPTGSEVAPPQRGASDDTATLVNKDPKGRIRRDETGMVQIAPTVVPSRVRPGGRARVRVQLRLDPATRPYWNNEAEDLLVWVDLPKDIELAAGRLTYPNPAEAETQEHRVMEFELSVSADRSAGRVELPAYALYYVCQNKGAKCRYLRQDFGIAFGVDESAPTLR